jgi:DNA primase
LILQAILNHPSLLHDHLEELAELEFGHSDTQMLKGVLIDLLAHDGPEDRAELRLRLEAGGYGDLLERIRRAVTTLAVWGARLEAGPADVLETWKQLVALHRQWHSLTKELKDAERALGQDGTEASYTWLRDVKARLSAIDGTEALIEGFGASSGRPVRSW